MRIAKESVAVVLMLLLMLFAVSAIQAAAPEQNQLSGRLIFARSFPCERCPVNLLLGVQPVATAYVDGAGNFNFGSVQQGTYIIHVELPGYEQVDQQVEVFGNFSTPNTVIMLTPKSEVANHQESDGPVVHVSEFPDRYPKKAVESFKRGLESKRKGKNDQTIKYMEESLQVAPSFYEAHNELGIAYKQAGRIDEAEREFLRAHDLNQTAADPLVNLTSLYVEENKADRAVVTGEKAIKANSSSASAFLNFGVALYKAAMLDRAEAVLKRALELAPKMFQVRLMLANVYLKESRYDPLLEQLNDYLAENPNGEQRKAVEQMREQLLKTKGDVRP